MSYTIAEAADATGLNKKTLLRAIKSGKINGTKDERGEWLIEPDELHHVFPLVARRNVDGDTGPPYDEADVEALGAQIEALLRQAGARLRQQLDDVRRHRDAMAYSDEASSS